MTNLADDYEEFIASIISGVRDSERIIRELGFGRSNTLRGKSGQLHQIDVSFIDRSFDEDTLVLIECKRQKPKNTVSVDVPKVLTYNAMDLKNNPELPNKYLMIIVSTSDFQKGTRLIAEYEDIRLHIVNHGPPFGFDYEGIIFSGQRDQVSISETVKVEIQPPLE